MPKIIQAIALPGPVAIIIIKYLKNSLLVTTKVEPFETVRIGVEPITQHRSLVPRHDCAYSHIPNYHAARIS